jgi:hypothetical protein
MASKIVVIEGGAIKESGTHDLVARGGKHARMFALQAERLPLALWQGGERVIGAGR